MAARRADTALVLTKLHGSADSQKCARSIEWSYCNASIVNGDLMLVWHCIPLGSRPREAWRSPALAITRTHFFFASRPLGTGRHRLHLGSLVLGCDPHEIAR